MKLTPWLSGLQFKQLHKPCVYAWKRKERYLYIGKSIKGILRPSSTKHEVIGKEEPIQDDDVFEFYFQQNENDDLDLMEKELIQKHRPAYNYQWTSIIKDHISINKSHLLAVRPLGVSYEELFANYEKYNALYP